MEYQKYNLGKNAIEFFKVEKLLEIKQAIERIIQEHENSLPEKDAAILLKPNLNNDLIALTGCTTDLRIITAVIESLQKRGYENITIGDGPNCGAFHEKINVHSRLGLKRLGELYGVKIVDFNHDSYGEKPLGKRRTKIARTFLNADYIINLPKIKTHTEARYSGALKNLVGCNKGYEKRNVHWDLHKFIIELNRILKPDLHIMDGLVAMEGNGPGAGTPKKLGIILASENPYVLDAFTSRLVGFEHEEVPHLMYAEKEGLLKKEVLDMIKSFGIKGRYPIKKPSKNTFVNMLLTNYFVLPRYWKIFDPLFATKMMNWALVKMHIRQDLYTHTENTAKLEKADGNHDLDDYCPMNLKISDKEFKYDERCIKCMYCFVAGKGSINADGELGYFSDQIRRYEKHFNREF